jgi:hypothetical protein
LTARTRTEDSGPEDLPEEDPSVEAYGLAGGRPSKREIPVARESVLINALRMGLTIERACELVGVTSTTFRRWKKADEELEKRTKLAKAEGVSTLAQVQWDLALHSSSDAIRFKAAKYLLSILDPNFVERVSAGGDTPGEVQDADIDYLYL